MAVSNDFTTRMLVAREGAGHTQQSLAEATGLSLRTIQRIEKGEVKPRSHSKKAIATALAIDLAVSGSDHKVNRRRLYWSAWALCFIPFACLLPLLRCQRLGVDENAAPLLDRLYAHFLGWSFSCLLAIMMLPVLSSSLFGQVAVGHTPWGLLVFSLLLAYNLATLASLIVAGSSELKVYDRQAI